MFNLKKNKQIKLYLHIKSFYYYYLERDLFNIYFFFKKNKLYFSKKIIIYLPTTIRKFSVVRSPFVSKLSKEQFEIRIYRSLIILSSENNLFMDYFKNKIIINLDFSYYRLSYFYFFK
jgi:ribosomal protein S10